MEVSTEQPEDTNEPTDMLPDSGDDSPENSAE
jgi:hypothetical protein